MHLRPSRLLQYDLYAECAKNTSLLYRKYRYIEDRFIGVLSHKFYELVHESTR